MKTVPAFVLILMVVICTNIVMAPASRTENFDPVPYEKLLSDIISQIINGNYTLAISLIKIGLSQKNIPKTLQDAHVSFYYRLYKLCIAMKNAESLNANITNLNESLQTEIHSIYYELYNEATDIRTVITKYVEKLSPYAEDKAAYFLYFLQIKNKLENLDLKINTLLDNLRDLYIRTIHGTNVTLISIHIESPKEVYAGDRINLTLFIDLSDNSINVSNSRIQVSFIVSDYFFVYKSSINIPSTFRLSILVPDSRYFIERNTVINRDENGLFLTGKIYVKVTGEKGERIFIGTLATDIRISFVFPRLSINVPPIVKIGEPLIVRIQSYLDQEINVSLYLDKISNETNLINTTIFPGINTVKIDFPEINPGYHTIITLVNPSGKIIRWTYSSAIAIVYKRLNVALSIPRVIVGPSFNMYVKGDVLENQNFTLKVFVDGRNVGTYHISPSDLNVLISENGGITNYFIWIKNVTLVFIPDNNSYISSTYSFRVIYINTIFMFLLVLATSIVLLHPMVTSQILLFLNRIKLIRKRFSEASVEPQLAYVASENNISIKFRKPRLLRYYRLSIELIARVIRYPHKYETIREYLLFLKSCISNDLYILIRDLHLMYEKDLYSRVRPNENTARKILMKIVEMMKQ